MRSFHALGMVSVDGVLRTNIMTTRIIIHHHTPCISQGGWCVTGRRLIFALIAVTIVCQHSAFASRTRESPGGKRVEKEKRFGQVFTPAYLVEDILDFAGYIPDKSILKKHIIDNSCGNGAFLTEVVRRYSRAYFKANPSGDAKSLALELGNFIHGIELDSESFRECLHNLDVEAAKLKLPSVKWDVRNVDTMMVDDFDGKMDFVVGNPPYVRVHNLDADFDRVKSYKFCGGGMTDLYLVFYEIGLRMLSSHGRLCYIAPSSWINSLAGKNMREYIQSTRCLRGIIDLEHFQPFAATAYTAICLLENGFKADAISYSVYSSPRLVRFIDNLDYNEAFFDGALYLSDKKTLKSFKVMKTARPPSSVEVKNGFATLSDDVFIADDFPFDDFVIPVIKASTGKWRKAIYPYDHQGKPVSKKHLFANRRIARYMDEHKGQLLKGRDESDDPTWYLYGRSQALKDVWLPKYAINTVVRDVQSIKFNFVPAGSGVYSGLYVVSDVPEERLRAAIISDDFIRYVSLLKKYKSGGYYTFNSRELKQYLDFKLQPQGSTK